LLFISNLLRLLPLPTFNHQSTPSFPLTTAIMLSRRLLVASRSLRVLRAPQSHLRYQFPAIQQIRSYADKIVKVPDMAESISEGTLKQFSKQVGDFVEQDEEIATIETDKVSFVTLQLPAICSTL